MLTPFLSLVITTLDELLKSENICPKIPQQLLFMLSSPADWTTATHFCTVVTRASRKQGRIPPDYTQTVYIYFLYTPRVRSLQQSGVFALMRGSGVASHYAKPTGQRYVGPPKENGTTFSD